MFQAGPPHPHPPGPGQQPTKPHCLGQVHGLSGACRAHSSHTEAVGLPRGQAVYNALRLRHQFVAQLPLPSGRWLHLHPVATQATTTIACGGYPRQRHGVVTAPHHLGVLWGIWEACGGGWLVWYAFSHMRHSPSCPRVRFWGAVRARADHPPSLWAERCLGSCLQV